MMKSLPICRRLRSALQTLIAALMLGAAVWVAPAEADIYLHIDASGVMHFTNAPTSGKFKLYLREVTHPVAVPTPTHYDPIIAEAADLHGLSRALIKAVIKAESDFDPRAVSKRGAMGLMQIMPDNFRMLGVRDPFNPRQNIMAGCRYLNEMLQRFGKNLHLALAAYNAGPGAVEQYNNIPPFPETQEYVQKVMRYFAAYRKK